MGCIIPDITYSGLALVVKNLESGSRQLGPGPGSVTYEQVS